MTCLKRRDKSLLETAGFCILPWVSLQINPNGKISTCYKASKWTVGDLHQQTLAEVWNGSPLNEIRKQMLKGDLLEQCRSCYQEEALGRKSLRQEANEIRYGHCLSRTEDALIQSPLFLDVAFSNKCTYRCRICGPHYSTGWAKDAEALGHKKEGGSHQ